MWIRPSLFVALAFIRGIRFFVCRDVIDLRLVDGRVERAPILVRVVQARDRPLFDRTLRPVALFRRLSFVLRRGIGAEVAVPIPTSRLDRPAGARTKSSGPRSVAARTAGGTRKAARGAGAGSAAEAAGPRTARSALLARPRFAHREAAAFEGL